MRSRGAPRHVEPRLRPDARHRSAAQGGKRRRLARRSATGRSAREGGDPRRRLAARVFPSRTRVVVASRRPGGRRGARRDVRPRSSPTTTAAGSPTCAPSTRCGRSATPARAKKIIDDAARSTPPRSHLDRRLSHRLLVCDGPAARGDTGVEKPCAGRSAGRRGRRDRVGACRDACRRGADHRSRGRREHGIRRRVSVLRLPAHAIQHRRRACQRAAAGRPASRTGSRWHERVREQGAEMPGAANCSAPRSPAGQRFLPGRLTRHARLLGNAAPALSASGNAMGWGYRYHIPLATALAMRGATDEAAAVLATLDKMRRPFRMLDYERSLARAWLAAGQGAVTEAITIDVVRRRNRRSQRTIRRRGGMPADRRPVRGSFGCVSAERTRIDRRGATREAGRPVRRRPARPRRC